MTELAAVLVPGTADPYRIHGLADGDAAGLAAALRVRLAQLDPGLIRLIAGLLRGPRPAVSRFLETISQVETVGPMTDWVQTHQRPEQTGASVGVTPLDVDAVAATLGENGPLARLMDGYEPRPSQVEVLRRTCEALNRNRTLLMEAPTGTGKSLAYLIPSAFWALQNRERVLIATHTIALQEQLLAKDLPLLERMLERPVRAAVLKGRSNYICLRKWEEELQNIGFQSTDADADFLARISAWVGQTATGDKAEVLRGRTDAGQWEAIASDTVTCIGASCKWYANHCFSHRARREAHQADLLITNHALLCAQLRLGNQGFPAFRRVIVDEAHQLESVATGAFTATLSFEAIQVVLNQLTSSVVRGTAGDGQVRSWSRRIPRPFLPDMGGLTFPPDRDLFDLLNDVTIDARQWLGDVRSRLKAGRLTPAAWERQPELRDSLQRLGACLSVLALGLKRTMESFSDRGEEGAAASVRGRLQTLDEAVQTLKGVLTAGAEQVCWVETDRLNVAPLYPGSHLKERLFDAYPTVVLVSATLAVGGAFDHTARSLGLSLTDVETGVVDSPFAWKEQALLLALDDAPAPRGTADPAYVRRLTDSLGQLLPEIGGQCLVLFTANAVLEGALDALKPALAGRGIVLAGQGIDGTAAQLVERLKTESNLIVFGSGSFWEGVDVPGEALSCLIITRLPFRPPDSPVSAARAEWEERQGRNPFETLSLPEAVIRFRQGFGRLIRTRTDRGVVIVMDNRILPANSRYADLFLSSLPPVSRFKGSMATVVRRTREWLQASSNIRRT